MFEKHWEFATGRISSMRGESWKKETPKRLLKAKRRERSIWEMGSSWGEDAFIKRKRERCKFPFTGETMGVRWS
jgi:hypothetical protein